MKRTIAAILSLLILFSLFSFSSYAASALDKNFEEREVAKQMFKNQTDEEVGGIFLLALLELSNRGRVTDNQIIKAIEVLDSNPTKVPAQTEYQFGQGTYIVGTDLPAGTYDIVCESTANDSYTNSMSDFSGMYSEYGLGDYFNALGGMMESLDKMSVKLINSKGWTDKYLDLKAGESARIILEDGMKIDIADGTAKLTFIR